MVFWPVSSESCVQNLHGRSVERTVSRRSRHSSFHQHKVVVSRRLNRTSLVFAKSTQFHPSVSRLFFPFSGVPLLSSNPSGIHPSRISRLLILISPCESFLFSCYFRPPRFRFSLPRFLFTFSFYPFLSLISFLVLNTNHNSTRAVKWSIFRVFYLNATVYFFK